MNVVCVSCFDYYETRMRGLIEYFKNKGYDVKYLITDFNHFSKSSYEADYGCSKQLHVIPYSKNISPQRLISHYIFSKKVLEEIKKTNPEVIYCVVPPNSLVKCLGKYRRTHNNCKLVFDVYDAWPESFPIKKTNFLVEMAFKCWANLRDKYIHNADLLVSVSKSVKSDLEEKFGIETKVLLPTISLNALPDYDFDISDKISFLYLGHVNYITDTELGTKILTGVARNKKVELHIIGEGQNKDMWVNTLTKAGVNVVCHGVVFDDEEKRKIFSQCNMGLNIPRAEINSSMALKSVEYMRYGLPFVNSGIGDNGEIVRLYNTGLNVADCDVEKRLISLKEDELRKMHNNTVRCYESLFIKQDYNDIFSAIMG